MQELVNIKTIKTSIKRKNKRANDKMLMESIEKHLLKSEEDIINGRVRDAREVFKEWKEKYGI